MAAPKPVRKSPEFDLYAHEAPETRTTWQGLPIEFHAARLRLRQRRLPLAGPVPVGVGLAASLVVRAEGFKYVPTPSGTAWTEVALLEVVRFDLEGLT
jgi:hypothetical protein